MDQSEKRNMLIAIVLSTAIFLGWSYFFDTPKPTPPALHTAGAPAAVASNVPPKPITAAEARTQVPRLTIDTPTLTGSLSLKGALLDDLVLKNYQETTKEHSPHVALLMPKGSAKAYYAEFGWVSAVASTVLPTTETLWHVKGNQTLTPTTPVVLEWSNGQGLTFERTISVDQQYLFQIKEKVINHAAQGVALQSYGYVSKAGPQTTSGFYILHEGPIGYLDGKLKEVDYKDLKKAPESAQSIGGWLGLTDKYWLTALIPDQHMAQTATFHDTSAPGAERVQVDFLGASATLDHGQSMEVTHHFFAGAKILDLLDAYEQKLDVKHFDLAVDFGWFYFLTKPIFHILTYTHEFLGNFGLAIMLLTVLLKLLFFPLANKSYHSMARMRDLQPEMERLRERFKDDKLKMNQELMELYKKKKINPMAGCLPMIVQIPVFFALYKVMFVSIEMRQAPFYGWIKDLSAPDPTSLFNLFGLISWDPPSFLMLGVWPLLMGATMLVQQRLTPMPGDPMQQKVMMIMPIMFTFMLAQFPAGLVIYWTWNNILTIAQQWTILRLHKKGT